MKMRVLVLGANGYVGRNLVAALRATDWATPIATSRSAGRGADITLDATDALALRFALENADAAVNCVAGSPQTMVGTARALRAAIHGRSGPRLRLVHISSMAVYGSARGDVTEQSLLNGNLGGYSAAKASTEQLLTGHSEVVTLRPGCIYGPDSPQWSLRIARLLRSHRIGDLGDAGDGYSNLVYIDDVIAAILGALSSPTAAGHAYNLAMDSAPSWNRYFSDYARVLNTGPLRRIGAKRLKLETHAIAPVLKAAEIAGRRVGMTRLPPAIPPSLASLWKQDIRLVSEKARSTFGLQWTPLSQGLRNAAASDVAIRKRA